MPIVTGLFATKHLANMMTSLFIIAGLNLIIVVFNVFHERNR